MKKRVVIFQNSLKQYRVACWNLLAEKYDLTLAYYNSDDTGTVPCFFKKIKLNTHKIGQFCFLDGVRQLAKQNDAVIIVDDLHVPSYCILPFLPRKYKVLIWSIGFRVSYIHPYNVDRKHGLVDKINELILKESDAAIFYMKKGFDFWKESNLNINKLFVAPNTTEVLQQDFSREKKKNILFVGTLYKGKGVDLLIQSYREAIANNNTDSNLIIVGDGDIKEDLTRLVEDYKLTDRVIFTGAVYDEHILAQYFSEALICVSPTQGGLTCPKSMGYAVPFITSRKAITGGEIYHITNGVNGIMYNDDKELTAVINDAFLHPQKYIEMGIKAKEYYDNNATPQHMANGAIEAIEYALCH